MSTKQKKMSDFVSVEKLQHQLSYANRVIELFLPPETSDTLEIMQSIVERGMEDTFQGGSGMTIEEYAKALSFLTHAALHTPRIHDEESF